MCHGRTVNDHHVHAHFILYDGSVARDLILDIVNEMDFRCARDFRSPVIEQRLSQ